MSRFTDEVILEYSHLQEGDIESSQLCPSCRGGGSQERSMSVGRTNDWLWWRCHRASCGLKGSYHHGGLRRKERKKDPNLNRLEFGQVPLSSFAKDLATRFSINEGLISKAGWRWTKDYGGRVVMPIFNETGRVVGHTLRSYNGGTPKALVNRTEAEEQMCWYSFTKYPSILVIVEDQPSALRLAGVKGLAALALIGTHINYDRCLLIKRSKINNIALSLDEDAKSVMVRHAINFRSVLPSLKLINISPDIKDMNQEEFDLYTHTLRGVFTDG